jgi:DNA-binding response OmpR family regulator
MDGPAAMKRILFADDDASVRKALAQLLVLEQFEVVQAASGKEAVAKFNAAPPDLVLLDLGLPDIDGWEVFESMQKSHPSVPVIIITAKSHQYRRAAGLRVNAIMEKPLDIPVLLEAIRNFLTESTRQPPPVPARSTVKTLFLGQPEPKNSPA